MLSDRGKYSLSPWSFLSGLSLDMTYDQIVQVHRHREIQQNLESRHLNGCPEDNSERASKCSEAFVWHGKHTDPLLLYLQQGPPRGSCDLEQGSVSKLRHRHTMRSSVQSNNRYLLTYLSEIGTWNLKLYLSLRVWIWYFHKNNGFALNKGTFSFLFPSPLPPGWVVCCVCLCIHGLFLVFVCIRVGAHMCVCVHVGEDPRSAWRIPLQHSSTFSQSNPESLASWLWWSLSALSGAEIVGGRPHPPGIYRGFWGFELWSLCLHN